MEEEVVEVVEVVEAAKEKMDNGWKDLVVWRKSHGIQ
jgi:hypothetical protein